MLIQGGFRQVKGSVCAEEFLKTVAEEAPNGHYFVAQPPPGIVMTAALDWRVVAPDADCAASLAPALWSAYQSLVRPLKDEESGREPVLFIHIKNLKGEYDQFTVGNEIDSRDLLMHRVRESVAVLLAKDQGAAFESELAATAASDYWQKLFPL